MGAGKKPAGGVRRDKAGVKRRDRSDGAAPQAAAAAESPVAAREPGRTDEGAVQVSKKVKKVKKACNSVTEERSDAEPLATADPSSGTERGDDLNGGGEGAAASDLENAHFLTNDKRWLNKQRTLVFSARGGSHIQRHLILDLRRLMAHSKEEPKWENRRHLVEINDIAESHNCNNVIFFESRKRGDIYMWLARPPHGPSAKFLVHNVHTSCELRMAGNCLLHSRPLIIFDKSFDTAEELRVLKPLFIDAFGTPRNHPKSKPFHDHAICFFYYNDMIHFRHYQILPMTDADANDPERQMLTEIGPRFSLEFIRLFDGSFGGATVFKNEGFETPALRRQKQRNPGVY